MSEVSIRTRLVTDQIARLAVWLGNNTLMPFSREIDYDRIVDGERLLLLLSRDLQSTCRDLR